MADSIVIWGAPFSGKTTYLLSLVFWQENHEANERDRRRALLPANSSTADWIARMAKVYADGQLLPKTGSVERLDFRLYDLPAERPRFFQWRRPPSRAIAHLTFWDAPGEFFSGPIPDVLLPELVQARGLVLIINPLEPPSQSAGAYWQFFDAALRSVQGGIKAAHAGGESVTGFDPESGKIPYPVAICLSQIDRAPDRERDPSEWVSSLLGRDEAFLKGWLSKSDCFTFTATGGREPGGDPDPRRVMYPIEWLLKETGGVA